MIVTPTIKELMLDRDRVGEIRDYIAEGREQYGMQTFDQHLADLVSADEVEFEVALAAATRPSDFELKMRTFRRVSSVGKKIVDEEGPDSAAAGSAPAAETTEERASIQGLSTGFDF
jgi:twitching motility protein PilT